jgi:hypothetical protein
MGWSSMFRVCYFLTDGAVAGRVRFGEDIVERMICCRDDLVSALFNLEFYIERRITDTLGKRCMMDAAVQHTRTR